MGEGGQPATAAGCAPRGACAPGRSHTLGGGVPMTRCARRLTAPRGLQPACRQRARAGADGRCTPTCAAATAVAVPLHAPIPPPRPPFTFLLLPSLLFPTPLPAHGRVWVCVRGGRGGLGCCASGALSPTRSVGRSRNQTPVRTRAHGRGGVADWLSLVHPTVRAVLTSAAGGGGGAGEGTGVGGEGGWVGWLPWLWQRSWNGCDGGGGEERGGGGVGGRRVAAAAPPTPHRAAAAAAAAAGDATAGAMHSGALGRPSPRMVVQAPLPADADDGWSR